MPHWQYCQDGMDITSQPDAAIDADEMRLWDESGELIIAVTRYTGFPAAEDFWCVSASDSYPQWVESSDYAYSTPMEAIIGMFSQFEHIHEASDEAETFERNGVVFAMCDLCGETFEVVRIRRDK